MMLWLLYWCCGCGAVCWLDVLVVIVGEEMVFGRWVLVCGRVDIHVVVCVTEWVGAGYDRPSIG